MRVACWLWWKAIFTFLAVVVFVVNASAGGPVILGGDDLTDHGTNQGAIPGPASGITVGEMEPNDSTSDTADSMAIGDDYTGEINTDGGNIGVLASSDVVSFSGAAGQTIIATTVPGTGSSTLFDSRLALRDADGVQVPGTFNDDINPPTNLGSQIIFTLPDNRVYFLQVVTCGNGNCDFSYTLQLREGLIDGTTLTGGWLYIQKALENIAPSLTRANDGSVAVLGSADSSSTSGNAGAAYHFAVPNAAATTSLEDDVTFYNGATAINQFFTDLAASEVTPAIGVNPAIIVTVGEGALNDLDTSEGAALTANADGIANFVNSGGGLIAHGFDGDGSADISYGWLTALIPGLPGASVATGCDKVTLSLTLLGQLAFPGLTNEDIRPDGANQCHNHFLNHGLPVLARDTFELMVTPGPGNDVTVAETEENNTSETADPIAIGDDYTGEINTGGMDGIQAGTDYASFFGAIGQTIIATTLLGTGPSTLFDSQMRLFGTDGKELARNDDINEQTLASQIIFTLPRNGIYSLQVLTCGGEGCDFSYTLQLREVVDTTGGRDIIIGGSNVGLPGQIALTPEVDFSPPGTNHTVTANVVNPS
jgi:hypothetical protein